MKSMKSIKSIKSIKSKKMKKLSGGKTKKNSLKKCAGDLLVDKKNKVKYCVGRCPHAQGQVRLFLDLDKFVCNMHGSEFSKTGTVLKGPATSPLHVRKIKF
jgi:nitrite reductase/ring-hydroxylating ferredoxin subunit